MRQRARRISAEQRKAFTSALLGWGPENKRRFPWRSHHEPYSILVGEMMLRRTRADQVAPVFNRFLSRWPTLNHFLRAPDAALKELLNPLGLVWRIRNFVKLREHLLQHSTASIPSDYQGLMELPGVGDYVASAVCCFCHQVPRPLIDTNSVRVIGRYFGMPTDSETRRRRHLRDLAASLVPTDRPAIYNYAILDLAAAVCTPRRPRCSECPLSADCYFARPENRKEESIAVLHS